QGVAKPLPVRVARLVADLTNGINQQPPSGLTTDEQRGGTQKGPASFDEWRACYFLAVALVAGAFFAVEAFAFAGFFTSAFLAEAFFVGAFFVVVAFALAEAFSTGSSVTVVAGRKVSFHETRTCSICSRSLATWS
ncbi:MAG: hypothetical protein DRJ28_09490, partial [Actinobacteria bacterium]